MWQDVKMLNAISSALIALVLLALVASGLWWVAQRPMFTLHTIRIESSGDMPLEKVNALTVRSAAVPRIHGNFFTADLTAVRAAFEAVPWVRKAMVRREWPDRLVVKIEEHKALGTWGEDGKLLSQKGDVFTANLAEAEDDGDLLEFDGPPGSEKQVVARLALFRQWFAPIKLEPESLVLSNRYAWTVRLDNGMTVELGRDQGDAVLKERVARLVAVYPQLLERLQGKIESVDLRYPNGMALKADGMVLAAMNGKKK
ncbi:cell division protein FtsQ/DivIB [Herbaspirillum huttiense]|jgi:cell division protein FtsQ|uniref:cell division protein FtsQ/DivIB n=1 Tax=Herbaspirillum TaxID=963 RepID=UPI0004137355|nr:MULTISPECIES: cell division protein FtsQ/DivIB [Herbaspirillum]MAF03004.1 cell division protein FtsQ [Herbaspirillum sp.]MBN9354908.1 cell division protein FtsQ/DivIB [Herbaspirillum huttiense]MBO18712.1 cell division protein FtsQ [Herbaspirillum sp.]MCP3654538.1 FtsQ-type POTRA domain-containing protein [Herbaspirillum sp.]MCP3948622.1 FtsQ-type POTRA domain-containing protein [Herbaspirillum sp.]|tara:strand:+ start:5957 stop:6727 length:771 start_codon:yes stop_codon:yes gene_type:complete